jgi:hypothetical protein
MRIALICLGLFGGFALAACGGGDGGTGNECFLDEGQFRDIEVGAGLTPRFTWCGAPAMNLNVRRSGGASSWNVECADDVLPLCIDPPIVYGDTVEMTDVLTEPVPLVAGQAYELCLAGVDGRPATVCEPFTP